MTDNALASVADGALKVNLLIDAQSAREAYDRAASKSRKLRRAQHHLEAAIADLEKIGYNVVELQANLEEVIEKRGIARIKRQLAREVWMEAAQKATKEN